MAKSTLKIQWEGKQLENTPTPVYLGVTLDRTLSFRAHVEKVRIKLSPRCNVITLLANSSWGADPQTLRTTSLALCYSTAEYCAAVWCRSAHAHRVNAELIRACRTITGNLKTTPLPALYRLSGISPPEVRRETIACTERSKQLSDTMHPHQEVAKRLKSRRSFTALAGLPNITPQSYRLSKWNEIDPHTTNVALPDPSECLPPGTELPRVQWVTLNRARAKVARTGDNMVKWGHSVNPECPCGAEIQTMEHIMSSCSLSPTCTDNDLKHQEHDLLTILNQHQHKSRGSDDVKLHT
ncbi:uncharacterized protein LOC122243293, partial [Penaeus japonicus]|uniref:uncharacterized protein LOC122243293 n=1 Tax=Penaeus japonicus TaxID=27405 RepID=UPI001C712094